MKKKMRPHFEEIQAHYDLSDNFFGTFQDPSRTYSCAFFERDGMSLEDAQMAHCAGLQAQCDRIRSTTRFHWWPRQIHKRRGPRRN